MAEQKHSPKFKRVSSIEMEDDPDFARAWNVDRSRRASLSLEDAVRDIAVRHHREFLEQCKTEYFKKEPTTGTIDGETSSKPTTKAKSTKATASAATISAKAKSTKRTTSAAKISVGKQKLSHPRCTRKLTPESSDCSLSSIAEESLTSSSSYISTEEEGPEGDELLSPIIQSPMSTEFEFPQDHRDGGNAYDVTEIPEKQVKIDTLKEAYIIRILHHIDPSDLINLAQTSMFFKRCVDSYVQANTLFFSRYFKITSPNDEFFRQFGHVAKQIVVDCAAVSNSEWAKEELHVLTPIAEKCDKNLESLVLKNVRENLYNLKRKDAQFLGAFFGKLKKMAIVDCDLRGWDDITRTADLQMEVLLLEFFKQNSWHEYIKRYPMLKALRCNGIFPHELITSNKTLENISIHSESLTKANIKTIRRMENLKYLTIDISGSRRVGAIISPDFVELAKIPNLKYLFLKTSAFNLIPRVFDDNINAFDLARLLANEEAPVCINYNSFTKHIHAHDIVV
ncbi:hypothetical protein Bhyg_14633, partial [Pseudolycoriella hygida]